MALLGTAACADADDSQSNIGESKWSFSTQATLQTLASTDDHNLEETAQDDLFIYWATSEGFHRAPKAGGKAELVTRAFDGSTSGLAVDDRYLYWTSSADTVHRVPKTGGTSEIIADKQHSPSGIVVDESRIYWVNTGAWGVQDDPVHGEIVSMAKGGGAIQVLATGEQLAWTLHLVENELYWYSGYVFFPGAEPTRIRHMPKTGGTPQNAMRLDPGDEGSVDLEFSVVQENIFICQSYGNDRSTVVRYNMRTNTRTELKGTLPAGICHVTAGLDGSVWVSHISNLGTRVAGIYRGRADRDELWSYATRTYPKNASTLGATGLIVDQANLYWGDYFWDYQGTSVGSIVATSVPMLRQ